MCCSLWIYDYYIGHLAALTCIAPWSKRFSSNTLLCAFAIVKYYLGVENNENWRYNWCQLISCQELVRILFKPSRKFADTQMMIFAELSPDLRWLMSIMQSLAAGSSDSLMERFRKKLKHLDLDEKHTLEVVAPLGLRKPFFHCL